MKLRNSQKEKGLWQNGERIEEYCGSSQCCAPKLLTRMDALSVYLFEPENRPINWQHSIECFVNSWLGLNDRRPHNTTSSLARYSWSVIRAGRSWQISSAAGPSILVRWAPLLFRTIRQFDSISAIIAQTAPTGRTIWLITDQSNSNGNGPKNKYCAELNEPIPYANTSTANEAVLS